MKKNIITTTGYGGTGSSAITDLLKEFENVKSFGESEFWFLQAYDGISDLEYHLIDGNHRSKVNLAIKKFKKYVRNHNSFYSKFFGSDFEKLSLEYLNNLIDVKFKKAISSYELSNTIVKFLYFRLSFLIQKVFLRRNEENFWVPKVFKYYSIPDKKRFYHLTKSYTNNLFNNTNTKSNVEFLAFDQLVPPSNINRYFNYVDNLKVIVVDRDPRDLYLLNETIWKGAAYVCDTSDVYSYVNWYKSIREHRKFEQSNNNILFVSFEDLIYEYNNTLKLIYSFLKIDEDCHIKKGIFFNPNKSKLNTKLWKKKETIMYQKELRIIEKELSEFCYK